MKRLSANLMAVMAALMLCHDVEASPAMEKLFFILKQKGSITADEYRSEEHDLLMETMRQEERSGSKKAAVPAPVAQAGLDKRLNETEQKLDKIENAISTAKTQVEDLSRISDNTSPATLSKKDLDALLSDKWYERVKLRGYAQVRYIGMLGDEEPGIHQPSDALVSNTQSLGIRRGRLVLSGDVSDMVYVYMQADYMAAVGGMTALQARDVYADISLDPAREFRVRLGLSKVPYGFTNMQSSQNRYALERADAINSAVEGERDMESV